MSERATAQHIPGPWCGYLSILSNGMPFGTVRAVNSRDDICYITLNGNRVEAHTRLIAAAPELLATLKKFVAHYPDGANPALDAAWYDARAAIAKAEGGQ